MVSQRAIQWARSIASGKQDTNTRPYHRRGWIYCPHCMQERPVVADNGLVRCKSCHYSLYVNPYMPTVYDTPMQKTVAEGRAREGAQELAWASYHPRKSTRRKE